MCIFVLDYGLRLHHRLNIVRGTVVDFHFRNRGRTRSFYTYELRSCLDFHKPHQNLLLVLMLPSELHMVPQAGWAWLDNLDGKGEDKSGESSRSFNILISNLFPSLSRNSDIASTLAFTELKLHQHPVHSEHVAQLTDIPEYHLSECLIQAVVLPQLISSWNPHL